MQLLRVPVAPLVGTGESYDKMQSTRRARRAVCWFARTFARASSYTRAFLWSVMAEDVVAHRSAIAMTVCDTMR